MIQFQENVQTDKRTDRRNDGQSLFYGTLQATAFFVGKSINIKKRIHKKEKYTVNMTHHKRLDYI